MLVAALGVLGALAAAAAPELAQLLAAGATLVALVRFSVSYSRWASTNLVLTDDRLLHRRGLLVKESLEIPLDRVHAVRHRRTVLGRLLRYGELVVETGDDRHRFHPVPRPVAVHHEISRQLTSRERRGVRG